MAVPVSPEVVSVTARAMPKSITLIAPLGVIMMLDGLISRWTIPAAWLCSSASSTTPTTSSARSGANGPSPSRTSRRVAPSTSSITRYGTASPLVGSTRSPVS